jgi:hypothetical protein
VKELASFTFVGKGDKNRLVSFFKLLRGFPSFYRFTRSKSRPIPSKIATLLIRQKEAGRKARAKSPMS